MTRVKRLKRAMRRLQRAWRRAGFTGLHYVRQDRTLWEAYQDAIHAHGYDSPEAQRARTAYWDADTLYVERCHAFCRLSDAIDHIGAQLAYARADEETRWCMRHDC